MCKNIFDRDFSIVKKHGREVIIFPENFKSPNILSNMLEIKPEAHGPQRSPECTAMTAIFSQNTVNVACKKN